MAFLDGFEEPRDLVGGVLQVGVEQDEHLSLGAPRGRNKCRGLSAIIAMTDYGNPAHSGVGRRPTSRIRRTVIGSIVDEDDFSIE